MDKGTAEAVAEIAIPMISGVHAVLKKRGTYQKVIDWISRREPYDILLLGASGTGKSSFLRSLQGLDPAIRREDRTDSVVNVDAKLGSALIRLHDVPGEELHESKRRQAIQKAAQMKPLGLINVVSFGYHEGSASATDAVKGTKPSEEFLKARRVVEIALLDEWTPWLCGTAGAATWLITVVTKADLWWQPSPDQKILRYYRGEEYHNSLGDAKTLPHSVRAYSSLNQKFYDVAPMSGFYTDKQRASDRASLVARILELTANGK